MTWMRAQRFVVRLAGAIVLALAATVTIADAAGDDRAPAVPRCGGSLPIAAAHRYRDVIRARFEARNRATGNATEFELLYGASGPLAEIPVHAVYQPRWWLQVELFLDETDES